MSVRVYRYGLLPPIEQADTETELIQLGYINFLTNEVELWEPDDQRIYERQ